MGLGLLSVLPNQIQMIGVFQTQQSVLPNQIQMIGVFQTQQV
jgi:hypothetical protein